MEIVTDLRLPLSRDAAFARQLELAQQVELTPPTSQPKLIGAADVAYAKDGTELAFAAVVVLERDSLEVVDRASWIGPPAFAYQPGLFALREATTLLEAFKLLDTCPDVILVDGHGIAHPRRFGIACQLGLTLGVPTVGCAKKRLCGDIMPLDQEGGSRAEIRLEDDCVGYALRTQTGINPVFVSPGHRYDCATAVDLIMSVRGTYRIPEPLRQAHNFSVELRSGRAEDDAD